MDSEWTPPAPRTGLAGEWDKFIGPGQTRAEAWLVLAPALAAGAGLAWYASAQNLGWSTVQTLVAVLLALDLMGGVTANATRAARRWYHRPGQGTRQHLGFVAVHAVQLFLVAWLFRGMDWLFFGVLYAGLMAASAWVLAMPRYIQRPAAMLFYTGFVMLGLYAFSPTPGMEWFVPVFYLKLLVAHLLSDA